MLRSANEVSVVKGIISVCKTKLGLSFLLAFLSLMGLSLLWNLTDVGSPAFRFIAAIIRPGWNGGHYLAAIFFGNDPQHRAATALMGLAGELLAYATFWYAVMAVIRRMRSNKRSGSDESFSRPQA